MTESKKTEPVDNFPYLVYTDEANRTYDGNGGGGGAGVEMLEVTITEDNHGDIIATIEKTAAELFEAMKTGVVFALSFSYTIEENLYEFAGIIHVADVSEGSGFEFIFGQSAFIAESEDEKPSCAM